MQKIKYGLIVGCWLILQSVSAQTPYMRPINYPYQLPTQTIYDIYTDTQGLIWLGTDKGLFQFNGEKARKIPYQYAKQNDITNLQEDAKKRIWGMNFANQLFYLEKDTLKAFTIPPESGLEGNIMKYIVQDDLLWVCTMQTFIAIHIPSKKVIQKLKSDTYSLFVDCVFFQNQLFLLTEQHIFSFENNKWTKKDISLKKSGRFIHNNQVLLVGQRELNSFKAFILKNKEWLPLPTIQLPPNITTFHYDYTPTSQPIFWICSKQGAWQWNILTGKVKNLFPNMEVSNIAQDYQGGFWVSTLNQGLWYCPSLYSQVYTPIPPEKLENGHIMGIYEATDSSFWLTTSNGLTCKSDLIQRPKKYFENNFKKEITTLIYNKNNQQIINTVGIFDTTAQLQYPIPVAKDIDPYNETIFLTSQSYVAEWILPSLPIQDSVKQLFGFPLNTLKSIYWNYPIYTIRNQRAYSVCVDTTRKKYWVGFADDLYEYDFEGNSYIIRDVDEKSILAKSLQLTKEGNLVVATPNSGFYLIKDKKILKHLHNGNSLKSNEGKLALIQQDTIWLGTTEEIGYWLPQNDIFYDVLGNNGIGLLDYKTFFVNKNQLLIGSSDKVIVLPRSIIHREFSLKMLPAKISQSGNNVTVRLESLHYKNPNNTRIYYRLLENSATWSTANQALVELQFKALRPQSYTLEYYAEDGLSGEKSSTQKIIFDVPAAWWQTTWVLLLWILLILAVLSLIFWGLLRRIKKQQRFKEALWISQLKAIKTQMNPHFLYNILNSVQGLVYSNRKSDAATLLGDFSDLTRKILESSEKHYISLQEEIELIQLYLNLEKVRFEGDDFNYTIQCDLVEQNWQIPSMLLQPYVENAIKHGLLHKKGAKRLHLSIIKVDNELHISILDNGVGRKHAQEIRKRHLNHSTQFSTQATTQRVALLNKMKKFDIRIKISDLENDQQQALGTQVDIFIKPHKQWIK